MVTKEFRTKTDFMETANGKLPCIWEIGLDIGYSSVKVLSPNSTSCFPSYAKRMNGDLQYASTPPRSSILYKDLETGSIWLVGEKAQDDMQTGDTSDSAALLYGRERYGTEMFKVLIRAGLGAGMQENAFGKPDPSDRIVVQTGLPERYMNDTQNLIREISGRHHFSLKIGNHDVKIFDFTIAPEDVYVMSQPKGTLFSVCIAKNGKFHPEADNYLHSSVMIFDPGFGTVDLFPIRSGIVERGETYSDLGMKRVLEDTIEKLHEKYGVVESVPAMQKALASGVVKYYDTENVKSKAYPFADILEESNRKVCLDALNRMKSTFPLVDFDYLVVTGGTGAAWLPIIEDYFKDYETLQLITGNQNDGLPLRYSNARG